VLQYLGESELERVLMAVSDLGPVSTDLRREVMGEAYVMSAASYNMTMGGVEYSRQLLARAVGPRRGAEILERISASQQLSSFEILRNADPLQSPACSRRNTRRRRPGALLPGGQAGSRDHDPHAPEIRSE
jgi:flagellar motor switch protein FliG